MEISRAEKKFNAGKPRRYRGANARALVDWIRLREVSPTYADRVRVVEAIKNNDGTVSYRFLDSDGIILASMNRISQ